MISEKLVHAINLNITNKMDEHYEYEDVDKLEEIFDILSDIDANSISFYNDPVGELTSAVLKRGNPDYFRMVNDHRLSHSFAKKLFGLDKSDFYSGKCDAVVVQYFSIKELDSLFDESDVVILVSPKNLDQIDRVKYNIDAHMYCVVVTKKEDKDEDE